jgi:hypothetical protein
MLRTFVDRLESRRVFSVPGVQLGIYHTATQLSNDLTDFATFAPNLVRVSSIGKSVQNRDIWALKLTDNPDVQEDEPEVFIQGAMHGNEPVGQSNVMYFIDYLLSNQTLPAVANLINNFELWFVPQMNPDGFALNRRGNANNVDLNRNFPEGSVTNIGTIFDGPAASTSGRAVETVALMNFNRANSFTLGANMHSGEVVVNYPFDTNSNGIPDYAATPDDALYISIAKEYSRTNLPMWNSTSFPNGITNGDAWYEVAGGIQDWTYRYLGQVHVTVELDFAQPTPASQLVTNWNNNRDSMMNFIATANWGIRGVIRDAVTGNPVYAKIRLQGNTQPVFSDPQVGDYHRMTLPGTYTVVADAPGYLSRTFTNVSVAGTNPTRLDFRMSAPETVRPTITGATLDASDSRQPISIAFSEFVGESLQPGDLTLTNLTTGQTQPFTLNYNDATQVARLTFASALPDGQYRISIANNAISDVAGNAMLATTRELTFLRGDANGDAAVNFADLLVLAQNYGQSSRTFSQGDFDYNGSVAFSDLLILAQNYGVTLPTASLSRSTSRKRATFDERVA